VLGVGGGENYIRSVLGEQGGGFEAAEAGHADVEEEDVDLEIAAGEQGERLLAAGALAEDLAARELAEEAVQAAARELFVVDDEDLEREEGHALF
jgi:hypothetical protein